MAGGESSRAHANRAQTAMKHEIESTGERRGARGLTTEQNGDGGGSGTAVRAEGRTADPGDVRAASSCTGGRERERENSRGKRLGRASICSGRGAGGDAPTSEVGARWRLLRCWADALAGLARSSGQLARVGWPRKEARRGGKGGGLRAGGRKGLRAR